MAHHDDVRYLLRRVSELETRVRDLENAARGEGAPRFASDADPLAPSPYVRELWEAGQHTQAIIEYRRETGVGLREAKERVEALPNKG